jgi:hypothetical protein
MKCDFIFTSQMERSGKMVSIKKLLIAAFIAVIVSIIVPSVKAGEPDDSNWPIKVTFSAPVQVGNMVLAPGTYEFRLTSGTVARNVITIFSNDSGRWVGMVMGINDGRVDTSKMTGFTFQNVGSGAPRALEYWFYSNWNRGIKFIYPHAQSVDKVAAVTNTSAR